jgi:hypothetical protein
VVAVFEFGEDEIQDHDEGDESKDVHLSLFRAVRAEGLARGFAAAVVADVEQHQVEKDRDEGDDEEFH